MKNLLISVGAFAMLGSAAIADEVEIRTPGVVIENRAADEGTTTSKTVRHDNG